MLEFLAYMTISIPVGQILLLMFISTISLLFGKVKLALLFNYIFTLHWAYLVNRDNLMDLSVENFELYSAVYYIFGLGIILVAAFAFLFQQNT